MIICLGLSLPTGSSGLSRDAAGNRIFCPLFGLAPDGVYMAIPVAWMPVGPYLTFPPLRMEDTSHARYLSVALSLESPPLGITQHPALRSSDFPRLPHGSRDHLASLPVLPLQSFQTAKFILPSFPAFVKVKFFLFFSPYNTEFCHNSHIPRSFPRSAPSVPLKMPD